MDPSRGWDPGRCGPLQHPGTSGNGPEPQAEDGRYRFDATSPLATVGAFGYTVRVVPRYVLLISSAELGVVALA
jgi:hypothetical protein